MKSPRILIIAGPNGAGKTTHANTILHRSGGITAFFNADEIALLKTPANPERTVWISGRIFLTRINKAVSLRSSFAFESTLSGRAWITKVKSWKASGYNVDIVYLWLPNEETAIARVAERVSKGGHDIPAGVVGRRFRRSLNNFFNFYSKFANSWSLIDGSGHPTDEIACRKSGKIVVFDREKFERIRKQQSGIVMEEGEKYRPEEPSPIIENMDEILKLTALRLNRESRRTGHPLVFWENGKMVKKVPDPLDFDVQTNPPPSLKDETLTGALSRESERESGV